jgi:CheY-like chemotaxis protein
MRKSLEEAQIRTKELMESRHKLLLSVSHDIKTPLNSIIGYLELSSDLNQLTSQDRASIRNSGKYILSLLDNILNFSSLERGKLSINTSTFNVYDFCEEIKEMFIPLARKKNLVFNHSFDFDNSLRVTSDLLKLKQIVANILSNAIKYTSSGSIGFHVRFENEKLYFTVSDTGTGIPKEQLHNIFKPFTRINDNQNIIEGSGFGLYVIKGLSDLLGGHISIDSQVDKGTTISVKVPAPAAPGRKKTPAIHKIWIIDDDPTFLELLKNMFAQLEISVTASYKTTDIDKLKEQPSSFDMILTDMEIGTISGINILHKIKEDNPDLPVYVMTGRGDFNQVKALEAGFDGYLPKPISINMLADLTESHIKIKENKLSSLREMFDNDEKTIRDILQSFFLSTDENIERLQQYINESNFTETQTLCHKMLPMFLQTGMHKEAAYLKKMDCLRGQAENNYPAWKTDGIIFIDNTRTALNNLKTSTNL